jgi:hypothetical protein
MHRSSSINHRINSTSFDDNRNNIIAFKQRRKFSRSFDSFNDHYEIRQVQQQFSIELPLPQPTNKHKLPFGKNKNIKI